jgi:hypothetical protein
LFYASRDRTGEHPERHLAGWAGILQADAFAGYNRLYLADHKPGPTGGLCWSHARRKFFELANIAANLRRGKQARRSRRSRRSRWPRYPDQRDRRNIGCPPKLPTSNRVRPRRSEITAPFSQMRDLKETLAPADRDR